MKDNEQTERYQKRKKKSNSVEDSKISFVLNFSEKNEETKNILGKEKEREINHTKREEYNEKSA